MEFVRDFYDRNYLDVKIIEATGSLLLGALGLYFVYRWGELLRWSTDAEREFLLGPVISEWAENQDVLLLIVSTYLGYGMLRLLIHASVLKSNLERIRRERVRALPGGGSRRL